MTEPACTANAGVLPHRTADPAEAFLYWGIDGAAILVTGRTARAALTEGVRSVFGAHLPPPTTDLGSVDNPGAVGTSDDPSRHGYDRATRTLLSDAGNLLAAHTDGALGFGDEYPDLLTLLCVRHAASGGESFLVDGQYLVDAIARDPAQRELTSFLWGTPIEQCARPGDLPAGGRTELRSRRPVASRTSAGRLTVRYNHQHQRVLDDGPVGEHDRTHLAKWHEAGHRAAAAAPRFLLRPGELLLVDNYRIFHGREPYQGTQRYFHRALAFTDMSFGAPPPLPSA